MGRYFRVALTRIRPHGHSCPRIPYSLRLYGNFWIQASLFSLTATLRFCELLAAAFPCNGCDANHVRYTISVIWQHNRKTAIGFLKSDAPIHPYIQEECISLIVLWLWSKTLTPELLRKMQLSYTIPVKAYRLVAGAGEHFWSERIATKFSLPAACGVQTPVPGEYSLQSTADCCYE